jgi:hypothetical protein
MFEQNVCITSKRKLPLKGLTTCLFLMNLTAMNGWSNNCLVVDDFSTGSVRSSLRDPNTRATVTQTGNMLGGVRGTTLFLPANGNPFFQPVEMDIDTPPGVHVPLVLTTGLRTGFSFAVYYGVDTTFKGLPLNYHPTGCDRLRLHFDSFSQPLNFNALVFQESTPPAYGQISTNFFPNLITGSGVTPFCVDLPFANFHASGGPLDFATNGISAMEFLFGGATPLGGVDFAITKIETVDAVTAARSPCSVVLPPNQ